MNEFNFKRNVKLIFEVIERLKLNLSGLNILTETGSGIFAITPIIAALANADRVNAWTANSNYGKGIDNIIQTSYYIKKLNLKNKINFSLNEKPVSQIAEANIITNLGFVRPINKQFLVNVKPGSVISYMCEKWEFRKEDINLEYCKKNKIKVAGVWENHPFLKIFDGCGALAIKLCNEAGFEVYQNNIIIWSNDNFGKIIKRAFENAGAKKVLLVNDKTKLNKSIEQYCPDFIFIADYNNRKELIGKEGIIDKKNIYSNYYIHLCGSVDIKYIIQNGGNAFPKDNGQSNRMSKTLAYLGNKPVIDLHSAGLKVGELLIKNKTSKLIQRMV